MSRAVLRITVVLTCLAGMMAGCSSPTVSSFDLLVTGHVDAVFRRPDGRPVGVNVIEAASHGNADRTYFGITGVADAHGSLTADLTVKHAGLVTITAEEWKRETGSGMRANSWPVKRALYLVSAPVGAKIRMSIQPGNDPEKTRVHLDRDADGIFEDDIAPAASGSDDRLPEILPTTIVEPSAIQVGARDWRITFTGPSDPSVIKGIAVLVYPGQPELQIYDQPFIVPAGSFMLFKAYDETGATQETREFLVPGGTGLDVTKQVAVDGQPNEVRTTEPGQTVTLTVDGRAKREIELAIDAITGRRVTSCCSAAFSLRRPDGSFMRFPSPVGQQPVTMTLRIDQRGTYTMKFDPYLDNIIDTTVTLTEVEPTAP